MDRFVEFISYSFFVRIKEKRKATVMVMGFEHYIPTRIVFGCGKFNEISKMELPGKKALIVISSGNSMGRLGYLAQLQTLLI